VNYYGIVRPQQNFNSAIGQLQSNQQDFADALQEGPGRVIATGHSSRFLNYQRYFLNTGIGAGGTFRRQTGTGTGGAGTGNINLGLFSGTGGSSSTGGRGGGRR
jgi:hypothetical protein